MVTHRNWLVPHWITVGTIAAYFEYFDKRYGAT